ncbi:MAG: hypothetical protein U5O39_14460 [Gammaproteobacteria bacterium]|nr:hypothetical protein [Gammaproteobacteria bacterium]
MIEGHYSIVIREMSHLVEPNGCVATHAMSEHQNSLTFAMDLVVDGRVVADDVGHWAISLSENFSMPDVEALAGPALASASKYYRRADVDAIDLWKSELYVDDFPATGKRIRRLPIGDQLRTG